MRRRLFLLLLWLAAACATGAGAQALPDNRGQRFVSIGFHDVVDAAADLETDAVTTRVLAEFFDWMKGSGWTAVTLDDIAAAHRGERRLPDKSILLSFDDGYRSLYTKVYPLLRIYNYPAVAALVGSWMEGRASGPGQSGAGGDKVLYGDRIVPRATFITWAEAREMQASGLVEFASHSYNLHRGLPANPQGNVTPAAITWQYFPATRSYEGDGQYRARIRDDLAHARRQMAAELGRAPRAVVWPYGRYSGLALDVARQLGFAFALTLEPEPASTSDLHAIHRYFPAYRPTLADLVSNLRFEPGRPTTRRIACLTLDALAELPEGAPQDEGLGRMIEGLRALGANVAVIDAQAAPPSPDAARDAPLGDVFFPTRLQPLRRDLLSRATWQIRTRGGADVFVRVPLRAAVAALGEAQVPALFGDLMRHVTPDGIAVDLASALPPSPAVADLPGDIRARRAGLDPAALPADARVALAAYRAAATIDPRQRLLVGLPPPAGEAVGPPDWADIAILPAAADAKGTASLAQRLRGAGWLRPDVAGRVALALPADPKQQVEALRQAQARGAAAFALCPSSPGSPSFPPPALASSFSSSTFFRQP